MLIIVIAKNKKPDLSSSYANNLRNQIKNVVKLNWDNKSDRSSGERWILSKKSQGSPPRPPKAVTSFMDDHLKQNVKFEYIIVNQFNDFSLDVFYFIWGLFK